MLVEGGKKKEEGLKVRNIKLSASVLSGMSILMREAAPFTYKFARAETD